MPTPDDIHTVYATGAPLDDLCADYVARLTALKAQRTEIDHGIRAPEAKIELIDEAIVIADNWHA